MSPEISEALCSLCRPHGWSFGVCWRFDRRDPRLLVMGDSYYEESIGMTISKMITQLHFAGEGTIGIAAMSGKHLWINSDTFLEGNAEWQHQFSAGMKTIAIISLPSFGVVQFGSTKKIRESLEFINQVRRMFCPLGDMKGNAYNTTDIRNTFEEFGSLHSSMHTSSSQNSINSFHDAITKELQDNAEPSTSHMLSSDHFPLGSQGGSNNRRPSAIPIISSPTGVSLSVNNPFLRIPSTNSISSLQVTSQRLASGAETEVLLLPNNMPSGSGYSFPSNSFATNLNSNVWAAKSSFSSVSHINPFHSYDGNSVSAHGTGGSQVVIRGSMQMVNSSLSSPAKSSSKSSSIASEPPDNFLSFPQDSAPEHSAFSLFNDDQTNDQIAPCDQPSVQVTNSHTLLTKDNVTTVRTEAISSSPSTNIPSKPVEICAMTATNSLDTGCDWKGSSSNGSNQLLSDNDLFQGMELDLSPGISRQECWDDIIMPVGSSSCSNLSTNVSDCMPDMGMGSLAGSDKGLFTWSSFEQLLEAVVAESANSPSGNSSIPVNISSIGDLDFGQQVSTVNRVDCPQGSMKLAPLAEFNLEKIFQKSSKEALVKSHVSSWTDQSGIRNAENVVTNQAKKPEETATVRKRARPGESTRPRPKDRQQIQDRVKELREIVPNGAKCSIDSLLDRTVKHMLFLQSVTKYAHKLKQTDEAKMIGDESGVILKDNSGGGAGGGSATWAYEVAGQTMVCPILVEDLHPPGQMLVEMLCEERGFFLEIAAIIRGFGLTILKGVIEIRERKIWARFLVEANGDVTRMDIFLSLVRLLQQMSSIRIIEQQAKAPDKGVPNSFTHFQQPHVPIPISLAARLQ